MAMKHSSFLVLLFFFMIIINLTIFSFSCNAETDEKKLSFRMQRLPTFNFLPRGIPIPPSGPSKRHNSIGHRSTIRGAP
ncbi:hypothetical protein IHE45_04G146800 [Dioscorea alata]|uniref:Uncharacterized protein n=1 Tax=Dioscorea alata TaxID=55571 RepID=A0ACB7WH70_DIOAL|nr:hypothetical protein IHE45_04G146800 [Dioscorea alata]